jgi:hypothetical protein
VLKASSFSAANIRDNGLVVLHNGTTPHDSFPVDLGSAATMNDVIASGVLFHNCTTHHDRFRVDPNMSANNVMTTEHKWIQSVFLKDVLFDDVMEL